MKKKISRTFALAAMVSGMLTIASASLADPFTIEAALTGDPRPSNPDNLFVDVTITGDTTSDTTYWTVDINSPAHPDIKLDAFFFNLDLDSSEVSFGNFDPSSWTVTSPASNATGSGSADFLFEADTSNPATDVTNSQNLTFEATLLSGFWDVDLFLNAGDATSSDGLLGSFQLGAHLQSLTAYNGQSDSGFATGDYGGNSEPIPEPMTMLLLGTGLAGISGLRLRKKL